MCFFFLIELLRGIIYFVTLFRTISSTYFATLEHLIQAKKIGYLKGKWVLLGSKYAIVVMKELLAHWNPINPPNIAPKKFEGAAFELPSGIMCPGN